MAAFGAAATHGGSWVSVSRESGSGRGAWAGNSQAGAGYRFLGLGPSAPAPRAGGSAHPISGIGPVAHSAASATRVADHRPKPEQPHKVKTQYITSRCPAYDLECFAPSRFQMPQMLCGWPDDERPMCPHTQKARFGD
jgi:hypothetical protein